MSELGKALVKLAKATRVIDLGPDRPQPSAKKVDQHFTALSRIEKTAMLEELEALGVITASLATKVADISHEQARRSLDRLETLERNKPTVGQVARYGGLGALAGPAISAIGNKISGRPVFSGATIGKSIAGEAAKGALAGGAVPLVRSHLDRKAEIGTLRRYMAEQPGA